MNPPNPFLQPKNNDRPENKFRGLIITGNVIGIVIILACFVITAYTIRQNKINRMLNEVSADYLSYADSAVVSPDVVSDYSTYSNYNAEYQEEMNDKTALELKLLIRDTATNRDVYTNSLTTIQTSTDDICTAIRDLYKEFSDTTVNAYSYNENAVTTHFFITSGRGGILLSQMHDYRSKVISSVTAINSRDAGTLKSSFPLDDGYANSYTVAWDNEKLMGSCYDALEYLKSLETEARNFEAAAFNKFPRSY